MTLETKAEFSRRLGVSRAYVTQLGNEGRLKIVGELVDVEASLALIAQTSAGRRTGAAEKAINAAPEAFSEGGQWGGTDDGEKAAQRPEMGPTEMEVGDEGGRLRVRKMRELLMREDRLIDLGLLRGDLLPRDEVNAVWYDVGVAVRAGCEAMVERLAPRLAACTDAAGRAAEIRRALAGERRHVKRMLLSGLRRLLKRQ